MMLQSRSYPRFTPSCKRAILATITTLCYVNINQGDAEMPGITLIMQKTKMEELPEQKAIVNEIAAALSRRGLNMPALIIIEAGHPLSFLGGQLLWVAQPVLSLFMPSKKVAQLALLLEEPDAVRSLKKKLEAEKAN